MDQDRVEEYSPKGRKIGNVGLGHGGTRYGEDWQKVNERTRKYGESGKRKGNVDTCNNPIKKKETVISINTISASKKKKQYYRSILPQSSQRYCRNAVPV